MRKRYHPSQKKLWKMLDEQQQRIIAQYLWPLGFRKQVMLCDAVIAYMQDGVITDFPNNILGLIYSYITGYEMNSDYVPIVRRVCDPRSGMVPNSFFDEMAS